jgi:lysozyme family protein
MSDFDRAFTFVIGEEGNYSNDPNDPGGETKFGISKRAHPDVDIVNLTEDGAKAIYKRDYWDVLGLDKLPWSVSLCLFDSAVNQGVEAARTLYLKAGSSAADFPVRFGAERLVRYAATLNWALYGRGWTRRVLRCTLEASR